MGWFLTNNEPFSVVVGASGGLGLEVTKRLAKEGRRVLAVSRDFTTVEEEFQTLRYEGYDVSQIIADLSKTESIERLRAQLTCKARTLIVVAGSGRPTKGDTLADKFAHSFEINVAPVLNSWEACRDSLEIEEGSSCVFISTIASLEDIGAPMEYSAAKAMLHPTVKLLSRRHPRVKFSLVVPGNFDSPNSIWRQRAQENPEGLEKYLVENVPIRRLGTLDEIADLVIHCAKNENFFLTGGTYIADGGQSRGFFV